MCRCAWLMLVFLMLVCLSSISQAGEVAVWGWYAKIWESFLKKEFDTVTTVIEPTEDGRIPVGNFSRFSLVILCKSGPFTPATEEDLASLREYLSNGGRIILFSGTVAGLFKGKSVYDLSRAESIIGATGYIYNKFASTLRPGANFFLKESSEVPDWLSSEPGLIGITKSRVLVGGPVAGGTGARLLINQVDKGVVFYCSPVVITAYKSGWEADPIRSSQVNFLKAVVGCALKDDPPLSKILEEAKPKKTTALRIGGQVRPVAIKAEEKYIEPAQALAKIINKATGSEIVVNEKSSSPEIFTVLVGGQETLDRIQIKKKNEHPYGYLIKQVSPDSLIIAGKNPTSTGYAVYDFLKRFAGYRSFLPGELGEIILVQDAISIPKNLDIMEEPSFITYTNTGFYGGNSNFYRSWRTTLPASHNFFRIYPPEKYGTKHPEYYTEIDGKKFVPSPGMYGTWQICPAHPDLPAIAVEYAVEEYFPKKPEALGFSAGINDGGGDCHCKRCEQMREEYNNPYIPYYNEIARQLNRVLPGKLVCFIAYSGAANVPKNIRLEPNIYVEVCSGLRNNMEELKKWAQSGAKNLGFYDYLYGNGYIVPRHYPHIMGQAWKKAFQEFALKGAWTESFIRVWLYDGPRQYVLNELAWNIEADIDSLLDDYFQKMYVEAANPMKRFFDRIEQIYSRKKDPLHPMSDSGRLNQLDEYTITDLTYLDNCLNEAKKLVTDRNASQRLALFEKIWGLSRLYVKGYLAGKELEKLSIQEVRKVPEKAFALVRTGMESAEKIAGYTMTPEDEKNIFTFKTNLNDYRNRATLRIEPFVEMRADKVFEAITEELIVKAGLEKSMTFWRQTAEEKKNSTIRHLLLTQVYLREKPEINLIKYGNFEPSSAISTDVFTDSDLQKFDWRRIDKKLPNWNTWHFQQSVTRFLWDPTQAHTGRYSFSIRENQIAGCVQTAIPVTPGCRYRLSFWVKQVPADKGGSMFIRWMNKSGWADQGEKAVPMITVPYPVAGETAWRQVTVSFTAPQDVTTCLLLFSAPQQTKEEGIWFDDVSLIKIYDPTYFAQP